VVQVVLGEGGGGAAAATPGPGGRSRSAPLIKLEDSGEDEWYRTTPSPPHHGDPGQGSSRWGAPGQSSSQQAPPPEDASDSNNDNSSHYTAFYLHFSM
jgi:hypothetical protein